MILNYLLDIHGSSRSYTHTPSLAAKQLPFHVTDWGHFIAGRDYFTERAEQDNYLMVYTISGSGHLKYRCQEFEIRPGQAFLIYCNEYQFYRTGQEGCWEIKWVHFNGCACKSYFDMINEDSLVIVTLPDKTEMERYMEEISSLVVNGDILMDVKLSMLITTILTELLVSKFSPLNIRKYSAHHSLLNLAIRHIQDNFDRRIDNGDLVKLVHMSEFHFIRLFRKYTGVSPHEYLTNYRINQSKTLLRKTNLTVDEISNRVGFGNVNNFIRDFKKLVGTTPLKYRNYWII